MPTSPPFKVVLCNLAAPITKEQVADWLTRQGVLDVVGIELPGGGQARYAYVELDKAEMVRKAIQASFRPMDERLVWISIAGSEELTPEGRCALADWIEKVHE